MNYKEDVEKHREQKNDFFKNQHYSPLTEKQISSFKALDYYDIDESYLYSVELKEYSQQQEIEMRTSTGNIQNYIRFGYVEFDVEGKTNSLTVYKQPNSDYLFVPFKDQTSGEETYGAGRYIELEKQSKDSFILDFNLAYNPYCAYSDKWTCPLTPFENNLKVEIKAGERNFHG